MSKKTIIADFGLLYAAAIWGSTFFIVKDTLNNIDPVILVAYRFFFASLILGLFLLIKKKKIFKNFKSGFILGIILGILYLAQTIGLKYTTASNSGFITGLFVIFVPIFSYFIFKKIPTMFRLISISLAALGLWFLTGGLKEINFGDIITLIASITYALHILFSDKFVKKKLDPLVLNFQQFFTIGIMSLTIGILFDLPFNITSTSAIYSVIFLTIFPTISAFIIQLVAQKITAPLKVALIFSMEPVFAAIFAWTLGNETLIISRAFGGLLIVIAMILSEFKNETTK